MTLDPTVHQQLKASQFTTWSSGDFAAVGTTIAIVGELLCETVDLRAGERVLDVATGSGNTALAAARRFTVATGVDFVPMLLDRARVRAEAEGLPVDFRTGDAEALPLPDDAFDVVLSTFGVMFAPDHRLAAAEMMRVLHPGGRIGMSNWLPEGFVGEMFRLTGSRLPAPPPGFTPPAKWSDEDHLRELFPVAKSIELTRRVVRLRWPSAEFWLDFWRTNFGPCVQAFKAVGEAGADAFAADLLELVLRWNDSGDDTLVLPQAYVDVVVRT